MKHHLCSQIQKQMSFNPLNFTKNVILQEETTENDTQSHFYYTYW
jgi:hypothetical protein